MSAGHDMIWPRDAHNLALLSHVHPADYVNPMPQGRYNLVVIGGGTAGLVCAVGAAGLGAKVALIERDLLGGDCLNAGCVPSKALVRSARAAHEVKRAGEFGVRVTAHEVDFPAVMERMRSLRARIAPVDGVESLRQKGVDVFLGAARFVDSATIDVEGTRVSFARAVIATGTRAALPEVPGLADAQPLTNETVFGLTELPRRLAVIGGGPIGAELAQVFARFGSTVTLYEVSPRLLPREDADASTIIRAALERDGVQCRMGARNLRVTQLGGEKIVNCDSLGVAAEDRCDQILVAAGRLPNVEELNLEGVGVRVDRHGVQVNDYLRTTNARIFACGDVCTQYKFTHAADALARIVIGNALFFGSDKASALNIPWAIYTNPELAQVGVRANDEEGKRQTIRFDLAHQDRALLDGATEGFIKVTHDRRGHILGATIVAEHAGELIGEVVVAMNHRVSLSHLANAIHPYPTQSEMLKRCGDLYRRTMLTPSVAKLLQKVLKWRR